VRFLIRMTIAFAVAMACCMLVIPAFRDAVLQRAGATLTTADMTLTPHDVRQLPADLLSMDIESGAAGVLALADLAHGQPAATVALMKHRSTAVDDELVRRGVKLPALAAVALQQLGVPKESIIEIATAEDGTTETTAALAAWAAAHPDKRVLVVVGPSHGRRYRRTLLRQWPKSAPTPTVVTSPYGLFRVEDWWRSRETLREGLFELEKLVFDYAMHPFN
jgi:hypothetical protein